MSLDLLNADSVDKLVEHLTSNKIQLDILVNNAGMAFKGNIINEQVIKQTTTCNYFNTKRLTLALLTAGVINENGRIINVSSGIGKLAKFKGREGDYYSEFLKYQNWDLATLESWEKKFLEEIFDQKLGQKWPNNMYAQSKIFLSIFSNVLARDKICKDKNIWVWAMCPGWCLTGMTRGTNAPRTPEQGAETVLMLMTIKKEGDINGHFFTHEQLSSIVE